MIPDNVNSYYGGLATNRLASINDPTARQRAADRSQTIQAAFAAAITDYPAPYRFQIVSEAVKRGLDRVWCSQS